ncbi:ferredoxin-type protein NapG [Trichlorobacter ammonificans]|uniref:Periplasmic nitrate reductase subunit, NapG n=1 Tax=Trichlorobacter ammonificans TaxID=2916410 RepID=A0ABM9DBW9_9BACT|nr:ferredoxin-type protein NapG [Trichlorobacter ammonificans]CAH2031861.1 Periplasmic nitrate reductase subunit, NapG [Trichlorobacter ammonificans]
MNPETEHHTAISRRLFLKGSVLAPLALALGGGAISAVYLRPAQAREFYLRPPGALAEKRFLAACVKCGKCAQACPYQSISMAGGEAGIGIGTPHIVPREMPCYLCPDIPCAKACPSGALDAKLNEVEKIRMGTAVIVDRSACLSIRGLRCEVCYRQCPLIDKAITLQNRHNTRTDAHTIMEPVVHKDKCVGCGICEKVCVLEKPAIVIQRTPPAQKDHYEF